MPALSGVAQAQGALSLSTPPVPGVNQGSLGVGVPWAVQAEPPCR